MLDMATSKKKLGNCNCIRPLLARVCNITNSCCCIENRTLSEVASIHKVTSCIFGSYNLENFIHIE